MPKAINQNLSSSEKPVFDKVVDILGFDHSSSVHLDDGDVYLFASSDTNSVSNFINEKGERNRYIVLLSEKVLSDKSFDEFSAKLTSDECIVSILSLSVAPESLAKSITYLLKGQSSDLTDLRKIGKKLDKIVASSLEELHKVRKLHKSLVPLRSENVKGILIESKYAAGEGPGGEFFDIIKSENNILLFLSSSCSYVGSSLILNYYDYFKNLSVHTEADIDNLIKSISKEINNIGIGDRSGRKGFEIFILNLNLKNCQCTGYNFGKANYISSLGDINLGNEFPADLLFKEKSKFSFKLNRNQKLLILSPGVEYNAETERAFPEKTVDFIKERIDQKGAQIIDEIFFSLKKEREREFLEFDSSVISIEVGSNAIIEV